VFGLFKNLLSVFPIDTCY